MGARSAETYLTEVGRSAESVGVNVPSGQADYQHIEYVGAGSISMGSISFGKGLMGGVEGLFTRGFDEGEADADLLSRLRAANLVMPAIRDPARMQISVAAEQTLLESLESVGLGDDFAAVSPLMSSGRMTETEVAEEAVAQVPALEVLRDVWDEGTGALSSMTLTSVGIAIGHAYWSRLTGNTASLSIWLP